MEQEDELNPWGSPTESRMSSAIVGTLLAAASAGTQIVALMDPKASMEEAATRAVRLEKCWTLFTMAEAMLLKELGRGKRMATKRRAEEEDLRNRPLIDDEEDDEFPGATGDFQSF